MPGPPERFAQGIGVAISVSATVLALGFEKAAAADAVRAVLGAAAVLESAFGFCVGCRAFAVLRKLGVIPDEVCLRCADLWAERH